MGINNRSLHTFNTDIQLSINLKDVVPQDRIVITESGINTHADVALMQSNGINTFLIGESLMRAADIGSALKHLITGA
jgi:indole-3-glycerol phosphate synthase